jgi:hypothetical protein
VDYYCSKLEWNSNCEPFSDYSLQRFERGIQACIQKASQYGGGDWMSAGVCGVRAARLAASPQIHAWWQQHPSGATTVARPAAWRPPSDPPTRPGLPAPLPRLPPQAHDMFDEVLISPHLDDGGSGGKMPARMWARALQ